MLKSPSEVCVCLDDLPPHRPTREANIAKPSNKINETVSLRTIDNRSPPAVLLISRNLYDDASILLELNVASCDIITTNDRVKYHQTK